jgi:hypothetical protein
VDRRATQIQASTDTGGNQEQLRRRREFGAAPENVRSDDHRIHGERAAERAFVHVELRADLGSHQTDLTELGLVAHEESARDFCGIHDQRAVEFAAVHLEVTADLGSSQVHGAELRPRA